LFICFGCYIQKTKKFLADTENISVYGAAHAKIKPNSHGFKLFEGNEH